MNEIFHWLLYLGLIGIGLMVLLWGLQFLVAVILVLIGCIMALWQWVAKQFKDDK